MALAERTRIEQWPDAVSVGIGPVEASVQNVEAEVAIYDQVVLGRHIGRETKSVGVFLPRRHGGLGTTHFEKKITHVVVEIAVLEFLMQLC